MFTDSLDKRLRKVNVSRANVIKRYKDRKLAKDTVDTYLDINLKFKKVREDLARFEGHKLLKVFDQNHLNLVIIGVVLVLTILFLGFFREYEFLQFPAAMSVMLIFSILTLMVGALTFWLRSWSTFVVILLFVLLNASSKTPWLNRPHTALGMDYEVEKAPYNLHRMQALLHPDTLKKDKEKTLEILDNWRAKFPKDKPPKMLLIACSGGGQRAALWTLHVLQQMHVHSEGRFMPHTQLITGASGGIVGAAFFRELYLRSLQDPSIQLASSEYREQISSDNLNPIIFTLMVNDLLIRNQYVEYHDRFYLKDRGFAFENQLNKNTGGVLDKPLHAYASPEYHAKIPMMPVAPLIVNDGRKLYISPHHVSYLCVSENSNMPLDEKSQAIDFLRFFHHQDAENLRFISALRMGATFPFVTPNIQLPSDPQMEIMDSGLSDNFGVKDALRFISVFEDWMEANTAGVVLVTIRDSEKNLEIEKKTPPTIMQKLITPLKNIYVNWDNVQTINNETMFNYMKAKVGFELDRIEFEYSTKDFLERQRTTNLTGEVESEDLDVQRASLNWRLTAREKRDILDCIGSIQNQQSLERLSAIFSEKAEKPHDLP